jgi:prepilin-type N-terminal cleavage/methylation domain-containing protein
MAATTTSTTGLSPYRAEAGFTLFELILVLVLLAVLLSMAAPSLRGFADAQADADAASGVLAMTRMSHDLAVTKGTVSRLNFDFQNSVYWVTIQEGGTFVEPGTGESGYYRLANGMSARLELPPGQEQRPYVQFMPDGRSEQAIILLICRNGDVYRVYCPSATDMFRIIKPTEQQP